MLDELIQIGVDSLFCGNDLTSLQVMNLLSARRIRIPEQLAVIGFDNLPFAASLDIPLTEVSQSFFRQGYEAAQILCCAMAGEEKLTTQTYLPVF